MKGTTTHLSSVLTTCLFMNVVQKIRAFAHVKFPLGMDLLKHGESAYPADAWVEQQYMKEDAFTAVSMHDKYYTDICQWHRY